MTDDPAFRPETHSTVESLLSPEVAEALATVDDVAVVREALEAHAYSGRTYDAEHPLVRGFAALDRLSERIAQLERERAGLTGRNQFLSTEVLRLDIVVQAAEARAAAYEEALRELVPANLENEKGPYVLIRLDDLLAARRALDAKLTEGE